MNISAASCTPIKPQAFKGHDDDNYDKIIAQTDILNDEVVLSSEIKKTPVAIASIALACIAAFAGGKKIASCVLTKAPNAAVAFEKGLKQGASKVRDCASKLTSEGAASKFGKVKNIAGKTLEKTEGLARKAYKKAAYSGIKPGVEGAEKSAAAVKNLAGLGCVAAVIPPVFSRDSDGNGVCDILQKGQNAYTGTKSILGNAMANVSAAAELAEALS